MDICIAHAHHRAREVLERALATRLRAQVTGFVCVEDLLTSSMRFDVFVIYNNFGHNMSGAKGAAEIRRRMPGAIIIGVSEHPDSGNKFLSAGVDSFLLRAGNEIAELTQLIQDNETKKSQTASPAAW
jgi:DNA-binding NarL/FixJ family response regulator